MKNWTTLGKIFMLICTTAVLYPITYLLTSETLDFLLLVKYLIFAVIGFALIFWAIK